MKVIRPTFITDAMLTSSDVPEGAGTAWSSATTYALDARVDVQTGTVIDVYQSLQAGNTNHAPASSPTWWQKVATTYAAWSSGTTYAKDAIVSNAANHRRYRSVQASNTNHPLTDTTWWQDIGATNRWAMFDQAKGSLSTSTGSMQVVLTPGRVDSLALLDVTAKQVTVTMTVSGVEKYRKTQVSARGGHNIDNWYDWFFADIGVRTAFLFDDLPSYKNGVITILIEGAGSSVAVAVGTLLIGRMFEFGTTLSGVGIGIVDYSKKDRDQFGVVTIVERPYSDANEYQVAIPSGQVDAIKAVLTTLRATPTIYIGEEGFDALFTYGWFTSFRINLTMLTGISMCSIDVEGLV